MKRILSVLTIVCLLVVLAVPAFASGVDSYNYNGVALPDVYSVASNDYNYIYLYDNTRYFLVSACVLPYIVDTGVFSGNIQAGNYIEYEYNDGEWTQYESKTSTESKGTKNQLIWTDFSIKQGSNVIMEATSPTLAICTGETCPATDVNMDNVCDDCGMPLAYNLRNDVYNYNGYYFPVVPSFDSAKYKFAFIYHNSSSNETTLHLSSSPIHVDGSAVLLTEKGSRLAYTLQNNEWVYVAEYEYNANSTIISNKSHLVWSSRDVYNVADELIMAGDSNFRYPLWMVTQGVMETTQTTVVGTMKILVLCGVGLIALLAVLKLFGKRSLISRG